MSSSFTIHTDPFVVRYSPYHGLKAVEVDLTDDPEQFMAWAGLDPVRFEKGFKTERDFWRWLACLPDDIEEISLEAQSAKRDEVFSKRFAQGWRKMAEQKAGQDNTKMPKGHSKARAEVVARFRDYIKSTLYADTPVRAIDNEADRVTTDMSQLDINSSPVEKEPPMLDAGKPRLLSDRAKDALDFFGKTDTWKSMLDQRRLEAKELVGRQRRGRSTAPTPTPSDTMLVSSSTTSTVTKTQTGHGLVVVHEKVEEMLAEPTPM